MDRMPLVLLILVVSLAVGWLAGGRVQHLAEVQLRRAWLVFVAVGAQLVLALVSALSGAGDVAGRPLLTISQLALLGFIAVNRHQPGMPLVLAGFALNTAVIVANGAMPVDPAALVRLGADGVVDPGKHQLLTDATRLPWLADIIPVGAIRSVISVGDIVLGAGVAVLVIAQMRRFPRRPGRTLRPRPVPPLGRHAREARSRSERTGP